MCTRILLWENLVGDAYARLRRCDDRVNHSILYIRHPTGCALSKTEREHTVDSFVETLRPY
jgi:hypothetical protein